jgi:pimeloyl-ACP methyl ester carboxylesterase
MNSPSIENDWDGAPMDELDPPAIDRLSEITAPALIIVGDKDLAPVLETADLLASGIKHARKAVIHDAAHFPNLEHPEEFNRIVLDFLLS